jgi:hypothetical protein
MRKWEYPGMVTDISEQPLPVGRLQMLHVLIRRMLMETNPEKLEMLAEQIRSVVSADGETETRKAA